MSQTQSLHYVRDEMLPQQPAPAGQIGIVSWLRANLFSSWINAILTLAGLFVIYWFISHFWGWFAHSVWTADSLAECRAIITEAHGEGATGACWAVIRERWHQYIFGFYPPELYWRPVMIFGLLMLVLAPILFSEKLSMRVGFLGFAAAFTLICMLLVKAPAVALVMALAVVALLCWLAVYRPALAMLAAVIYPFFAVWMLWGGSFWTPVMLLVGLAAIAFAYNFGSRVFGFVGGIVLAVIVAALSFGHPIGAVLSLADMISGGTLSGIGAYAWLMESGEKIFPLFRSLASGIDQIIPADLTPVDSDKFGGFLLAIVLGVGGIAMSLPLGIVLALGRSSNMPLVKWLSVMFIEFIRGVPLITLLFVASLLLNYFLPPGTNFDIILRVMILVTLFAAAYIAEVVRGGLAALPRGQYEAADALGLTYWKAQRLIVLPQALKISIPGIVSTFIGMFKDTTLVVFVGLFDPLKGISDFVRADFNWKGIYWEPYIFVAAIFFIINFSMSRYSMYLENRLKRDHR